MWLQLLFLHLEGGSLLCKDAAKMEDLEQGLWRPWDAQGALGELSFPRRLGPGERSLDKWKTAEQDGLLSKMWGRIKGAKYRFALQDGTWDFS